MSKRRISAHILQAVRRASRRSPGVAEFLTTVLCEEAEHSGQWWWKDVYKSNIAQYAGKLGDNDENSVH